MNSQAKLIPYWFLLFTIGFGWFVLAPLSPGIIASFSIGLSSALFLISLYGYAMVIVGLLSGFIAAKFTVRMALYISAILSVAGLAGRVFSANYDSLLVFQIIAAIAYPLAMAPVGSIADSISRERSHSIVGISVGSLFLGMSVGALAGPQIFSSIGLKGTFVATAILAVIAAIAIPVGAKDYPVYYKGKSLKGFFKPGMLKNWYIGLIISSFAVMFGGIASEAHLQNHIGLDQALKYAGLFGGLSFLGSALGAIIMPPVFERTGKLRTGMVITSALTVISVAVLAYYLSYFSSFGILSVAFFMFGFFGNAFWSMAMTSTTKYVDNPAKSGFATSMYSVATNAGVALVPVYFGPFFLGNSVTGISIVVAAVLVAFLISPTLLVKRNQQITEEE